ncbi:unnamed protein product, partial [Discosporangium mesarthrocarpum]
WRNGGGVNDCSLGTSSMRRQRSLILQYSKPHHPVLECVLKAYDDEGSEMNVCVEASMEGFGGLECILEALEACTEEMELKNDLREAGVVEWFYCNEFAAPWNTQHISAGRAAQELQA